tara:strand:+ start:1133 stop:1477 length:345 start_codon:yes stop_codon:yes gene_type:complete
MNNSTVPENSSGNWWTTVQSTDSKIRETLQELLDASEDRELSELVNRFLDIFNKKTMDMNINRLNPKMHMLRFSLEGMPSAYTLIYLDPLEYRSMDEETFKRNLRRIVTRAESS